ncbi:hypothetical protein GCM10027168_66850 [Streptomyces capparidis]
MELTPRERSALDGIAAELAGDRRLRRSLRSFTPPASRRRRTAAAVVLLCAFALSALSVATVGFGPQLVALTAMGAVFGGVCLVLWAARGG